MDPLTYLKAVIGAVGATAFPPLARWLVSVGVPSAPPDARDALVLLLVAMLTGGAVYATPNKARD